MHHASSLKEALGALILALGFAMFSIVCGAPPTAKATQGSVVINEVLCANKGAGGLSPSVMEALNKQRDKSQGAMPSNPDWLELLNSGPQAVSLQGWMLGAHKANITLPAITLPPGGFLIILAEGGSKQGSSAPAVQMIQASDGPQDGAGVQFLSAAIKLPTNPSDLAALRLMQPDGTVADSLGWVPQQVANVSWGVPGPGAAKAAGLPEVPGRTYLVQPTPGAVNSAPAKRGPHILRMTESVPDGATPGQPIALRVEVSPNLAPVQQVNVLYKIGFAQEQEVAATLDKAQAAEAGGSVYTASIPASAFKAGDLVRWAASASDGIQLTSRLPEAQGVTSGKQAKTAQWFGTVVGGVVDPDISPNSTVAVMEWFSEQPEQSMTPQGAPGSVFFFKGQLLDGVYVNRRGVTSLSWPKPKLKITLARDQSLRYAEDAPPVEEFGLQSHYYELGERSYMKEALGLAVLADAGVPTPRTFYLHMRLNGRFFGLFSFVESIGNQFLKRNDIPTGGPLFKSESGELSNLRWDIGAKDMPNFYALKYPRDEATNPKIGPASKEFPGSNEWGVLSSFTRGLAGGGDVPRTAYLMSNVDIPEVVNLLAAQVIITNQDRCTKNFYVYLKPDSAQWIMLPWDLDGALGQDNGLTGSPDKDSYCVLACEQWNSPLYCDSEHPQDLAKVTPWGTVTVNMAPPYVAGGQAAPVAVPQGGSRRALLQTPGGVATRPPTTIQRLVILPSQYPAHQGWQDPDRNMTGAATPLGAAGTFNYLTDAITDVNATRTMLMRRIRTLTDIYLGPSGKLVQMANATYTSIRPLAIRDAALWRTGIDIDRGYTQIISEYAPVRSYLLTSVYGPNGSQPLIPGPQTPPTRGVLNIKLIKDATGSTDGLPQVDVSNPSLEAVDISGWSLKAPDFTFKFKPGTVLPSDTTLHVVPDLSAFRAANAGKPLFFTGPLVKPKGSNSATQAGNTNVQLLDGQGQMIMQA